MYCSTLTVLHNSLQLASCLQMPRAVAQTYCIAFPVHPIQNVVKERKDILENHNILTLLRGIRLHSKRKSQANILTDRFCFENYSMNF